MSSLTEKIAHATLEAVDYLYYACCHEEREEANKRLREIYDALLDWRLHWLDRGDS
jgi:hypothetical protein